MREPTSPRKYINIKDKSKGPVHNKNKNKDKGYRAAWRFQPPKDGKTKSITVDGKHYIWCDKHKKWGSHKTSDCKGIGLDKDTYSTKAKSTKYEGSKTKAFHKPFTDASKMKLQLSKAIRKYGLR